MLGGMRYQHTHCFVLNCLESTDGFVDALEDRFTGFHLIFLTISRHSIIRTKATGEFLTYVS